VPELGLFPLPLVLMPTERLPLHIFEPRYKELIGECIESGDEFGLVLATGDGAVHEVGTRAAIDEVLEVLDDGAMNVVVRGTERFRLLELTSGRSFTTCLVEAVDDTGDDPDPEDERKVVELFRALAEITASDVELPGGDEDQLDFVLASRVDLGAAPKQELLASTSPRDRMHRLVGLFEEALEAARAQHALRERAGRNGKVAPLDD